MQDGLIRVNPAAGRKLPSQATNELTVLTWEEMQQFLIQAKEEGYYELFLLELTTGPCGGEVLALQWDDLNFRTGELRVECRVYRANGELVVSAPKTKAALRGQEKAGLEHKDGAMPSGMRLPGGHFSLSVVGYAVKAVLRFRRGELVPSFAHSLNRTDHVCRQQLSQQFGSGRRGQAKQCHRVTPAKRSIIAIGGKQRPRICNGLFPQAKRLQDIQVGECRINVLFSCLNVLLRCFNILLLKCPADMQIPIAEFIFLIQQQVTQKQLQVLGGFA